MTLRQLFEQQLAQETSGFRVIAGASNMAAISASQFTPPGCYVFAEKSSAEPNKLVTGVSQRVIEQLAIVIVVRNVATAKGSDAADELDALRLQAEQALLGWVPSIDYEKIEYVSGNLISFSNGFMTWKDSYKTARRINMKDRS
jgi:Cdc6-like AAA superfamily ATPase